MSLSFPATNASFAMLPLLRKYNIITTYYVVFNSYYYTDPIRIGNILIKLALRFRALNNHYTFPNQTYTKDLRGYASHVSVIA